jgi:aspartate aminotransferase-like enzyme
MSFQPISSQLTFCPTTPTFVSKVFTLSSPRKVKEIDAMVQALSKAPIKSSLDQVIYPGKVTDADTFRIGNIGHLFPNDIHHLIQCIVQVLEEMGVNTPVSY